MQIQMHRLEYLNVGERDLAFKDSKCNSVSPSLVFIHKLMCHVVKNQITSFLQFPPWLDIKIIV